MTCRTSSQWWSLCDARNAGGFSPILREHVLRFNGGLFESVDAYR
jgi:hypothetical protein